MRSTRNRWLSLLLVPAVAGFALSGCDIDQTQEGEMPDVEVEGGEMPEYDVETADVDVGTTKDTVVMEKPVVDVDMPDDEDDTVDVEQDPS